MKKLFIFFTIAFLAIAFIACDSDDNTVTNDKELSLKVDKKMIHENETVLFSAFNDKNEKVEADFYIDGIKVTNKHQFTTKGVYVVVAKKDGFADSSPLTVEVIKEREYILKKLILSADAYEGYVGNTFNFFVSTSTGPIEVASVIDVDKKEQLSEKLWQHDEVGVYNIKASKYGYFDSNEITITIKQRELQEKRNMIVKGINFDVDITWLSIVGNPDTLYPILFEENGLYFFVFLMNYQDELDACVIQYAMKVYVPRDIDHVVYPYEVDKSRVKPFKLTVYRNTTKIGIYTPDDFVIGSEIWVKPAGGDLGQITNKIHTLDKVAKLDYEGVYDELYLEPYDSTAGLGKKIDIAQRNKKIEANKRVKMERVSIK